MARICIRKSKSHPDTFEITGLRKVLDSMNKREAILIAKALRKLKRKG